MKTLYDITYEVIDPITRDAFITADRYVAEHHYNEKHCTVLERHSTVTQHSAFNQTLTCSTLHWNDNPEIEETHNESDTDE